MTITSYLVSGPVARPGFQAGIVVDVERFRVYVMTPEETVAAIDLRSGSTVWERELAALPLALHRGVLVAQRDAADERNLGLVLLDAVYEGALGDFTTHVPVACSTGGLTQLSFSPAAGNRYYLVVPLTLGTEGSYGTDGDQRERPPSLDACAPQVLGGCN